LVALRSLSLKPISFGYKTPPIRFSQASGQSAHKARPLNLELVLSHWFFVLFFSRQAAAAKQCTQAGLSSASVYRYFFISI